MNTNNLNGEELHWHYSHILSVIYLISGDRHILLQQVLEPIHMNYIIICKRHFQDTYNENGFIDIFSTCVYYRWCYERCIRL